MSPEELLEMLAEILEERGFKVSPVYGVKGRLVGLVAETNLGGNVVRVDVRVYRGSR